MSESPSPPRSRGTALLLLVALGVIWGATFPVARAGISAGADPFVLVAVDFLLGTALAVAFAALSSAHRPPARSLLESAGIGALMIGGINIPLFWGMQFATGGAAAIVYATSPAISLLMLVALQRASRPGALRLAGLGIGLTGVLTLSLAASSDGPITRVAALLAFGLGAACQGAGAVLIALRRPEGEGRWGQAAQFAGASVAALVALPFLATSWALPLTPTVVGSVLYFGVASMLVGYTVFFELIHRSGAVSANLVTFVNPIVALAVGIFAFGETFEIAELGGLALVLIALALLELPDRRHPSPGPSGLGESRASG